MASPTSPFSEGLGSHPPDFSLVLGGPLFQLLRRAHMVGDALELMRRRVVVISLFAWVPLLVLSALDGRALGGGVAVPFMRDWDTHARSSRIDRPPIAMCASRKLVVRPWK